MASGPRRTCIGCRRVAAPEELVRVIRAADGTLVVGRTSPGRGAWLCRDSPACIDLAERRQAFHRSLRAPVTSKAIAELRASLGEACEDGRSRGVTSDDVQRRG